MIRLIAWRAQRLTRLPLILFGLHLALGACAAVDETQSVSDAVSAGATIFAGADVLPMTGEAIAQRQTVVVAGNRILEVRPFVPDDLSRAGRVIDARGQFLMPGLVDMHVHFAPAEGEPGDPAQRAAAVMLAYGVTTARSMAGAPEHLTLRERLASGAIVGPRIYAGSPALSDQKLTTVKAAEEAVREIDAAGYDFIKSHLISDPQVWQAVKTEADRHSLGTAGHVSNAVGLERAIAGNQQIEHLDGFIQALLPTDAPERAVEFGQIPPSPVLSKVDRARLADSAVFDLAARAQSYQVPTLSLFEKLLDTERSISDLRASTAMRYVPDAAIEQWSEQRAQLVAQISPEHGADLIQLRREIVRQLDARGVALMAGSDTAQAFHVWGLALHEEIETLAAVVGAEKALRAATVLPAAYFRSLPDQGSATGQQADFGTIAVGTRADLLLLSANPLSDLSALQRPLAVMADGRFYDRAALDVLLDEASRAAKNLTAQAPKVGAAIFLTRHFEAEENGEHPLTAVGRAQARRLAEVLGTRNVAAIYVTDTARARQSAAPLAEALGLTLITYDPGRPDALLQAVMGDGVPALIVAHSNTAPQLARMVGVPDTQVDELAKYGVVFSISPGGIERVSLEPAIASP
ncbi:amidohydrolase family protein [Sphingomicrobium sp. XHP0239]|uniref:amidohydrolase family protein n=1 Tax=Sphingomicrobium maritimum TaxID=3133972 RepID=UPI0031CC5A1B